MEKGINTMIRILHVTTIMNPGGIETLLMNLYRHVDRDQIQFDFMVHRFERGAYDNEIEQLGGHIYRLQPISLRGFTVYLNVLQSFFQIHQEYQIVHSHLDALSTPVLRAAKKAGIPCRIAHSHTSGMQFDGKMPLRIISRFLLGPYCTDYFACSKVAGDWLFGRHSKYRNQLVILQNGIDTDSFAYNKEIRRQVRQAEGLENRFVVGHVGRFDRPKNHTFLLGIFQEICKQRNDAFLFLVGDGETMWEIQKQAEQLGLLERICFAGRRMDVSALMQAMDVFVFPSLYEGLGLVLVEAQACGLPCVASESIPDEVSLTPLYHRVASDSSASDWATVVMKTSQEIRSQQSAEQVRKAGYDIRDIVVFLSEFYLSKEEAISLA